MIPVVRSVFSLDVDLATWRPVAAAWAVNLRVMVGPDGGTGEESFDLTVCSAAWLEARAEREGIVDGQHHLVMSSFDRRKLESYVARRISTIRGRDWPEVATKLARFGWWEFEDYG